MSSLLEALVFIGDALDVAEVVSRLVGASLELPMAPIPRRALVAARLDRGGRRHHVAGTAERT
jgi:hypothetical protein